MAREREKIMDDLVHAKELIEKQPELLSMKKDEILQVLDDGSREMRGYRWGVVAYAYVAEIGDISPIAVIEAIKDIKSGVLTYEYIGYVLQEEYDINLVDLLLMAGEMGVYGKILPFVKPNLVYEKSFEPEKIEAFLDAYYAYDAKKEYLHLLWKYAKLLGRFDGEAYLCQRILDTQEEKYYDLMLYVCNDLYEKDIRLANSFLERFVTAEAQICKKLAIEFVYRSLLREKEMFEKYFAEWEALCEGERETYWKMLIPVYMDYVQKYEDGTLREKTIARLWTVVPGSVMEKSSYVAQMALAREQDATLTEILEAITKESFEKDAQILSSFDGIFYKMLRNGKQRETLEWMQQIFSVNGYRHDYEDFFELLGSVHGELVDAQTFILEEIIKKITVGTEQEFFFAIGLFQEYVVVRDIGKNLKGNVYSGHVLELVLSGVFYHLVEAKKVCLTAFALSELLGEEEEVYWQVCKQEIFENYPNTMNNYAKQWLDREGEKGQYLAKEIECLQEARLSAARSGEMLQDLRPSSKRAEEYRRAMREQQRRIQRMSEEKSVFGKFFPKAVMKYGKRNAYVQVGIKGEWIFQVNPYAEVHYELELPQEFKRDLLLLTESRRKYMKRREAYALNH